MAAGDLDGDALLELVVGGATPGIHAMREGGWSEQSGLPDEPLGVVESVLLVHLDRDDALDIVLAPGPHVFVNRGDGSFRPTVESVAIAGSPTGGGDMVAGDFDSNGTTDLVWVSDTEGAAEQLVSILYNDGLSADGRIHLRAAETVVTIPTSSVLRMSAIDLTHDGRLDLLVATDLDLRMVPGTESGLGAPVDIDVAVHEAHDLEVGDLDLDGDLDMLLCYGGTAAGVFPECPVGLGTVDGDGFIEVYLAGADANPAAIGARVVAFADGHAGEYEHGPVIAREVIATTSQPSPHLVHLGLPPDGGAFDVVITWPNGDDTFLPSIRRGARFRIAQP